MQTSVEHKRFEFSSVRFLEVLSKLLYKKFIMLFVKIIVYYKKTQNIRTFESSDEKLLETVRFSLNLVKKRDADNIVL